MSHLLRLLFIRALPVIALAHALVFAAFWLTNALFYASTNDYLTSLLKSRMDYISLVLWITGLIGLLSAALVLAARWWPDYRAGGMVAGIYAVLSLLYLALFYGSFGLLFRESPIQWERLGHMLAYYRLLIDPLIFLAAAFFAGMGMRTYLLQHSLNGKYLLLGLVVVALAGLWVIPLLLPPGSVYKGALPQKPKIIAHRGAAMLAPENTLASAEKAAELGVYGLETDIHISQDGQPFLMHDDTLERTTDVAALFPGRARARVETFTLAEVRRLNAGSWFFDQDPFKTAAALPADLRNQSVPTLAEELEIVRKSGLVFIFDLKQPPDGHPYNGSFFDIVLRQIQSYGIDPQIWYLVNPAELAVVRGAAPGMKPTAGIDYRRLPSASELKSAGYQIVNSEYGLSADQIRAYKQAGLWVNLYTVDEPWLYSRLWLLSVDSTTTNNSQGMLALDHPILSLHYTEFLILWSLIGAAGLAVILLMFFILLK